MSVTSPNTTMKMVNKKTRERLDGRAKKRSEYLKKKNTGAKATLYKGLNTLNNADKQVSKVFDKTIRYSNNGNHKETKVSYEKYGHPTDALEYLICSAFASDFERFK